MELARKLCLTGCLFPIPQQHILLRLIIAILISIGHIVLLMAAQPYKQSSTSFFATATSVILLSTLVVAVLITMFNHMPPALAEAYFGFDSIAPLIVIILAFHGAILALALLISIPSFRAHSMRLLRLVATDEIAQVDRIPDDHYHLFLSHAWITGQDQMRVVKQRLLEMLPGVSVFLDVDDLQRKVGKGAELLSKSKSFLLFASDGFFGGVNPPSRPCMVELLKALELGLEMIVILEVEDKHLPLTRAQLRVQMRILDRPVLDAHDQPVLDATTGQQYLSMYHNWGLVSGRGHVITEDVRNPGLGAPPLADRLYERIFPEAGLEPIEWSRIGVFQDV